MSDKFVMFPYKMGSESARNLARNLGIKRVYSDRNYRHKRNHVVINWGNAYCPEWYDSERRTLNHYLAVTNAANKLYTFHKLLTAEVPTPEWTRESIIASTWVADGHIVYGRESVTSSQGRHIKMFGGDFSHVVTHCPLYTKEFKSRYEFRVHVFNGKVIDFVQKKRRSGEEDVDRYIRNHNNGWVFCRGGIELPAAVEDVALRSIIALGLDFGAVDIRYNANTDKAVCLEVNTAPGLPEDSTTLQRYTDAIQSWG